MESFISNTFPTLGVEEEFHLVDPETGELMPDIEKILPHLDGDLRERVCYELLLCVVENRTGVFKEVKPLVKSILQARSVLSQVCERENMRLVASGSHPFSDWRAMPFVDSLHYRWVRDTHGVIAHRLLAFGLHIHVGVINAQAAVYIMHEMKRWAYPLLAFAANSPFFRGYDTGLASVRMHLFYSMPRTRLAPSFRSFADLEEYYERMQQSGYVQQPHDLWWTIRPQPTLGTVEFRIFDLPTDVRRIGVLAALLQAAVAMYQDLYLSGRAFTEFGEGYLEQNWWAAMKDGLEAKFIDPESGAIITARDQLRRLVDMVSPHLQRLNSVAYGVQFQELLAQPSAAHWQRTWYHEHGQDLRALELELARRTLDDTIL